jgi:CHAT domain-containing protein/Flp pilus assembly protein TadD
MGWQTHSNRWQKSGIRFLQIAVLGLLTAVLLHTGIAVGEARIRAAEPPHAAAIDQLHQGEAFYQTGNFSAAIALWQQAATTFANQGDPLNQARVLNALATAFEQLGNWTEANRAIAHSLSLLNQQPSSDKPTSDSLRPEFLLAQAFNIQGNLQLRQGQATEALASWQRAATAYQQVGDEMGYIGSQINQARALQVLGFYRRAATLLEQIDQTLQTQPDSMLKVAGLRNLGTVLQRVGDSPYEELQSNRSRARQALQRSLTVAEHLRDTQQVAPTEANASISGILLSFGNAARSVALSQPESPTAAEREFANAIAFYRQAAAIAPTPTLAVQAQSEHLSLLVQRRSPDARSLWGQIQPQLMHLPVSRTAIDVRISLAQTLIQSGNLIRPAETAQLLATAVQHARKLHDRRAESYALGTLGQLYEQTQQWDHARSLTQQALAQAINDPDIAYQWHWQLGRILCQHTQPCAATGNLDAAISAYGEAVNLLRSLRTDLVAMNPDVQFSFQERVEPVYRQLVELLLQSTSGSPPSQENLRQAREVIESLQLAELDNFFRSACLVARPVQIDQINPQSAVMYPIILPNRFAVILALPNQPLRYAETLLPETEIDRILDQMRRSLIPTSFVEERLPIAQKVYDLLLRPLADSIATSGVTTLVFVPDGRLRSLPMSALHDGQRYLIEQYSIALAPSLQLLPPQPLERQQMKGLVGGLSEARQGFAELPNVMDEVEQIQAAIPTQVLLNQQFTSVAFQTQMDTASFPLVHLATHGQFSSKAEDTFILTWDGRINVNQLEQSLRSRGSQLSPIDLLVLSACQTAEGDRRAALGMAGVAVRSGARSTLATLWSVSDRSTAALMVAFYQALGKPGITKAEALRQAQLTLLQQRRSSHPYYWAPFILLGNWL